MTVLKEYTEGKTTFLTADVKPYTTGKKQPTTEMPVFYNPRMRVNRDLSVAFLAAYMKYHKVRVMCEPLAGSGVRTLRYLMEVPGEFKATLCDANPIAIKTVEKNIRRLGLENRASAHLGDAKVLMLTESRGRRFDFIDIDPFGTPVPYLNAAVQSLNPKGALLGVTATDMPALCGVYPHVALRKYGGVSIRAPFIHEIAVRLLLGRIYDLAAMNDCAIKPLGVLSTDHYIRVWVHVKADRTTANKQRKSIGFLRACQGCYGFDTTLIGEPMPRGFIHQKEDCNRHIGIAGPLWIGHIFDSQMLSDVSAFLSESPGTYHRRSIEFVELMKREKQLEDFPYVDLHALCDMFGLVPPKRDDIMEYLRSQGFQASRTHFRPTAIRTTAPIREIVNAIGKLSGGKHDG